MVVLPLILTQFSAEEIVIWYLLSSIISLQLIADFGFGATFARVIAYGMGTPSPTQGECPDWDALGRVCQTMWGVYLRLTFFSVTLLGIAGTWALIKPISAISDSAAAWTAWAIVLVTTAITFQGSTYSAYLQGTNQIALLRRWEIITSIAAILTSFLVLSLGGGLLELVIANQSWLIINVILDRWLSHHIVEEGRFKHFERKPQIHSDVFTLVWPSAWRSGLGVFITSGVIQATNLIYAQIGTANGVASYLIALRIIQTISQFSQAPFYSKLPVLARLYSEKKLEEQVDIARRGMRLSYWAFTLGFIVIAFCAEPLLSFIGSKADFVSPALWALLGLGFFAERYGAMHLQFYSTTNNIVWHTVSLVHGILYITTSVVLFKFIGVYAFPIGLLVGYLGFYSWYSAKHSYQAFKMKFSSFEASTAAVPLMIIVMYAASCLFL